MRTLDDIVPPSRRTLGTDAPGTPPSTPPPRSMGSIGAPRRRFPVVTAIIALVVVLVAVALLFYFSTASVTVTPSSNAVTVSGAFSASASSSDLPFQIISTQKVATQSVQSTGTSNVSSRAQGTITINNSQKVAQKLITNTRFQSASGLVYRIRTAVTIPAQGSLDTVVYADQTGASYNLGPTTFKVPGLSGTPEYLEVTAKSSAAFTGGASGNQPSVDPATESSTRTALRSALANDLSATLTGEVPQGYVLLNGAATTTYQDLPPTPSTTSGMVDIKESATAVGVVMPNASLAKVIASVSEGSGYNGTPVSIQDPAGLTLTATSLPSASSKTFGFSLSGNVTLISIVDASRIASAIAGKSREAAQTALTNYPEVKQAVLILRPFWRSSFPQDPASIKVTVGKP